MLLYRIGRYRILETLIRKAANGLMSLMMLINNYLSSSDYIADSLTIVSLHKLGDSILTFPTVNYFIKNHSGAIRLICWDSTETLYRYAFPNLRITTISKDEYRFGKRIASIKSRKKIKSKKSETIVDITGSIISVSLIWLTGYKKLIGFSNKYLFPIYDKYVLERTTPHLRDKYFDVVRLLDSNAKISEYEFQKAYSKFDGKILIHPFGGWEAKEWGIKNFLELAERLKPNYEVKIIAEKRKEEYGYNIVQLNSLDDLFDVIKEYDLLIGNDSGPIHVADMFGKFTIAIYGPTNPDYCKPYGENNFVISGNTECRPTRDNYCSLMGGLICDDYKCMNQLSVDSVYNQISKILEKINANR